MLESSVCKVAIVDAMSRKVVGTICGSRDVQNVSESQFCFTVIFNYIALMKKEEICTRNFISLYSPANDQRWRRFAYSMQEVKEMRAVSCPAMKIPASQQRMIHPYTEDSAGIIRYK